MSGHASLLGFRFADTCPVAPTLALDGDFKARWAAWVARSQAHEAHVRRNLLVLAGLLAIGTASVYDLVH
jgi:hypothetical protein